MKINQNHQNSHWIQCYSPAPSGSPCLSGGGDPSFAPSLCASPGPRASPCSPESSPDLKAQKEELFLLLQPPCQSWEWAWRRGCITTRSCFSPREPGQMKEAHTIAALAETVTSLCCSLQQLWRLFSWLQLLSLSATHTRTAPLLPPPTEGLMVI